MISLNPFETPTLSFDGSARDSPRLPKFPTYLCDHSESTRQTYAARRVIALHERSGSLFTRFGYP